jgi:acyl-coenzyme A thioesterase PaaI-like protein
MGSQLAEHPEHLETTDLPWIDEPSFRCFGCSPRNDIGLALRMAVIGEEVVSEVVFSPKYASYPGVVHGGIVGVVVDEVMGDAIALRYGALAFSQTLRTKYLEPVRVGRHYRCIARVTRLGDGPFKAEADLVDAEGAVVVMASATFQHIRADQAREQMGLDEAEMARLGTYFQQDESEVQ